MSKSSNCAEIIDLKKRFTPEKQKIYRMAKGMRNLVKAVGNEKANDYLNKNVPGQLRNQVAILARSEYPL